MSSSAEHHSSFGEAVGALATVASEGSDPHDGPTSGWRSQRARVGALGDAMKSLLAEGRSSMSGAGAKALASGQWLAEQAIDAAGHMALRDRETLVRRFEVEDPNLLAAGLIKQSATATGLVGVAAGAAAGLSELSAPSLLLLPAELLVETLVVAAIEIKMIGELHEGYRVHIPGPLPQRALALSRAWAQSRGVDPRALRRGGLIGAPDGADDPWNRAARREVVRLVQRRMVARTARSTGSLAPAFTGAAIGLALNWRATQQLGRGVARDLLRLQEVSALPTAAGTSWWSRARARARERNPD